MVSGKPFINLYKKPQKVKRDVNKFLKTWSSGREQIQAEISSAILPALHEAEAGLRAQVFDLLQTVLV